MPGRPDKCARCVRRDHVASRERLSQPPAPRDSYPSAHSISYAFAARELIFGNSKVRIVTALGACLSS